MKGTKQNILRAATILFNERGVSNVSQRLISDHIAISPGNLTYHFKKKVIFLKRYISSMRRKWKNIS